MALELLREYEVHLDEVPEDEAGIGAFGVVLKSKLNGAHCAVKRLHEILLGAGDYEAVDELSKRTLLEKFVAEIKFLKNQRHPNIVQFLGVCTLDRQLDSVALVMEHMEASIKDLISTDSTCSCKGTLSLGVKISILKDAACGVSHLHSQNIIHRDLNAGNVLLTSSLQAKVADLGIARVFPPRSMNLPTMSIAPGATEFMPPEACKVDPVYGLTLDCFSFGHLALLLLIEDYPQINDYGVDDIAYNQALEENQWEILRRRNSFAAIEGHDQRILYLLKSCLNDSPSLRPTMKVIREKLDSILTTMDYEPPSLVKLQQHARQQQLLQEQLRANLNLLEEKNSEIQKISVELEEKQKQVVEYTNRCQSQDSMLNDKDGHIQQLSTELSEKQKLIQDFHVRCQSLESELKEKDGCIQQLSTENQQLIQDSRVRCQLLESEIEALKKVREQSSSDKTPAVIPAPRRWSFQSSTNTSGGNTQLNPQSNIQPVKQTQQIEQASTTSSSSVNVSPPPVQQHSPTVTPPSAPSEEQKVVLRKWPQPSPSSPPPNDVLSSTPFSYATLPRRRANTVGGRTTGPPAPAPKPNKKRASFYEIISEQSNDNSGQKESPQQPDFRTLLQGKSFKSRWMQNAQETVQSKDAEEELKRNRQLELQQLMRARHEEHDKDDDV